MTLPEPVEISGKRDLNFFIHNAFANFFKDSLDYFSLCLYPRFEYRVVSTYDKAVEYLMKKAQYNRETDKPVLPALILNPTGDFELADGNAGGHQLWRFPYLSPGLGKRLFYPVYQDKNTVVNIGFVRIQGDIELLMLLNSFYEYCDIRMMMIQVFGGLDRWIYPRYFNAYIILPDEFVNYRYRNEYTGVNYKLDWKSAGSSVELIKTTARDEWVLPASIKPIFKLTSLSDPSTRYGGPDKLADWRLGATIRYEIELPCWLILSTDYLVENINVEIRYESSYSAYESDIPAYRNVEEIKYDWGLDETSNSFITTDATCDVSTFVDLEFSTRYYHIVSQAEADSTSDVNISIPETISDRKYLILNSKYGELNYGDHYLIINNGNTLQIKIENVKLEKGMILELYVYKRVS